MACMLKLTIKNTDKNPETYFFVGEGLIFKFSVISVKAIEAITKKFQTAIKVCINLVTF